MVEFGLKLEDNKNAEWSEKYIDYERLKKLLKAAQKATEIRQELALRHPTKANEIQLAFERDRQAALAASTTSLSLPRSHSASTISTTLNQIAEGDENTIDMNLPSERTSPYGFEDMHSNLTTTDDILVESSSLLPPNHVDLTVKINNNNNNSTSMKMVDGTPTTAGMGGACATIDETSTLLVSSNFDTTMMDSNHLLNYGSHQNLQRADSFSNFSALLRGAKGVFDNYESKYKNALEAEYMAMEKFSIEIYREVRYIYVFLYSIFYCTPEYISHRNVCMLYDLRRYPRSTSFTSKQ